LARVRRLHRALLTAALPLTLVACGGDDKSGSGDADRKSRSPRQTLEAIAAELRKVRTYHVEGTQTDEDGPSTLSGDVSADGSLSFKLDVGAKRAQIIVAGARTYLKANAAFWRDEAGGASSRVAKLLTDRWIVAPEEASSGFESLQQLMPKNLAYCATRTTSELTDKGTRTFEGQEVVVIAGGADTPGEAPGDLYIAASGRALPVRELQTGPEKPGGRSDPRCDDDDDSDTTESDIRLSRFDEPVEIKAPPNPLDLSKLQGQDQGSVS
jgi:hypothetical protein